MVNSKTLFPPNVHGVPLSQPFRSVVWLLLQKQLDFRVVLTVPGSTSPNGSRHPAYMGKTAVATVPVLQCKENLYIPECCAILKYLCEINRWHDMYPGSNPDSVVLVDAYLHWHHHNTRLLRVCIGPYLRPDIPLQGERSQRQWERVRSVLQALNDFWLQHGWIGSDHVTIADLVAYEEVVQLTITGLINDSRIVGFDGVWNVVFPNVHSWVERMERLPFHDVVHACLRALGPLNPERVPEMRQVVVAASKAGLKAMRRAQESYSRNYSKL